MRPANDVLRFTLELGMLASLALGGWSVTGSPLRFVLAVGAPVLAAAVWGRWLAPRSRHRVADPWRLAFELVLFGGGAAALAAAGHDVWAAVFAALVAVHLALTFVLHQRAVATRRP